MAKGNRRPTLQYNSQPKGKISLRVLESFTERSLNQWSAASADLDQLAGDLYFGLMPAQRRRMPEIMDALNSAPAMIVPIKDWARLITYEFSDDPLSAAGSLRYIGGRFNAGIDLDEGTIAPWPALYLAENYETAFREKFQMPHNGSVDGLTPNELALQPPASHTTVRIHGELRGIFDATTPKKLAPVASVLRKIPMPPHARQLRRKLNIPASELQMIRTADHLFKTLFEENWRIGPIQFGLPSSSQIFSSWVKSAGFGGILYPSTKGHGKCLAVFPDSMMDQSFVELSDPAPNSVKIRRLDENTGEHLCGWHTIPMSYRPAN